MKGISMAIETIIYLILAIMVLSILLVFFLSQAGPVQNQYALEAKRQRACGSYVSQDFGCTGSKDFDSTTMVKLRTDIASACGELSRQFGYSYQCSPTGIATLDCIRNCCPTCPQPK